MKLLKDLTYAEIEELVPKKSSEFSRWNRCTVFREHELFLDNAKGENYDRAIVVKDIIKGVLKKEFDPAEIPELVDEGLENDYVTEETGRRVKSRLVETIKRAVLSEKRKPYFVREMKLPMGPYLVKVHPDAVFYEDYGTELQGKVVEAVLYKSGKPNVTQKGWKKDASVDSCLELYFLLCYARTLVPVGENWTVRASYYYLRKDTDTSQLLSDMDFFSGNGGNIVTLEESWKGGQTEETELDRKYMKQMEDFIRGEKCSDETCKYCSLKTACNYQKAPKPFERISSGSRNGKITPSKEQQKVIDFRSGVCRVNASAGSGKTESITERGARMLEEGCDPEKMLFITFTDSGAFEMKQRLLKKCQARNLAVREQQIHAMTFNTFAYRIICSHYEELGFTKKPRVIDEVRNGRLITELLNNQVVYGLDYTKFFMSGKGCKGALTVAAKVFEIIKTEDFDPENADIVEALSAVLSERGWKNVCDASSLSQLVSLYKEYGKRLVEENLLLFADQEPMMFQVLKIHPDLFEHMGYEHIVVDEFQDTNDIQMETLRRLTKCSSFQSLMVVGDDSQSIFGFRNTSQENILHFFEKIGIDGEDLYLTYNRRSIPPILELANAVNGLNMERIDKEMLPVREGDTPVRVKGFFDKKWDKKYDPNATRCESRWTALQIQQLVKDGTAPEDIAFLAAKNAELVTMAQELSSMDVPWVMMNPMKLMDNSRVQAAISLADAFYQPDADQLYYDYLVAMYDGSILEQNEAEVLEQVKELKGRFTRLNEMEPEEARVVFHQMLEEIRFDDEIYAYFLTLVYDNDDLPSELEYIQDFKKFGSAVGKKLDKTSEGVVLVTAHSSKGLEFRHLFVSLSGFDAEQLHKNGVAAMTREDKEKYRESGNALTPAMKAVEEKRRLLFVAVTRARDTLTLTGQYYAYGTKKDGYVPNQFLKEVFDCTGEFYDPVDHHKNFVEDIKTIEKKEKAKRKRTLGKKTEPEPSMADRKKALEKKTA